jgi:hypothetical protein
MGVLVRKKRRYVHWKMIRWLERRIDTA